MAAMKPMFRDRIEEVTEADKSCFHLRPIGPNVVA